MLFSKTSSLEVRKISRSTVYTRTLKLRLKEEKSQSSETPSIANRMAASYVLLKETAVEMFGDEQIIEVPSSGYISHGLLQILRSDASVTLVHISGN